jgi:hypothetical protein
MPAEMLPYFVCPACQRRNTWKQALAGKRAKCSCGSIIDVPSFATDLDVAPAPAPRVTHDLSKSVMAGIPHRKGLQPEPRAMPSAIPSQVRDVILPIALIAAGLFAAATDAMQATGSPGTTLGNVIGPLILNIVVGLGLAVVAVLGGSMAAGIAFEGPIWQNILKLCAVALLPLPIGSMAGRAVGGTNGDIVSALLSISLYFAVFWAVFKMAWSDRAVCVLLIWIIRSAVAYGMFKLSGAIHGYSI